MTSTADDRPNVVLIMADDLGYECLGSYGGESYSTPRLDDLAATGVRFTHAYALPLCTPTRLQLMTGKYNFRNWRAFGIMDPTEKTFAHHMGAAGYRTCISGKWQLYSYNPPDYDPDWRGQGMRPEQSGFDEYCLWHTEHTEDKGSRYANPVIQQNGAYLDDTGGKYGPDIYTDYILDFMERSQDEPFFVYYSMALTHGPFQPTPDGDDWETDRHASGPRYFGDMVEYMDKLVGRIVDTLDALGLRERTLILFLGDNGSPQEVTTLVDGQQLQGGKGLSTDAGTRVPLIANWLGTTPEGAALRDLVDTSDFLPTLMDAAASDLPAGEVFDGQSFLPQVRGEHGDPRDWIFAHHDPLPGWGKDAFGLQRWAQTHRWKLYDDGSLFDLEVDVLEERPVPKGAGVEGADEARARLEAVLRRLC